MDAAAAADRHRTGPRRPSSSLKAVFVALLSCCLFRTCDGVALARKSGVAAPPVELVARVGGHAVFDCPLDFPQEIEIPFMLHWRRRNQTIFSWHDGVQTASPDYSGRIILLNEGQKGYGKGSINLTAIRESDLGWYECKVMFPNRSPVSRNNGTWFNLRIEGENLIVIPPVNITALEGDEAQFECITKQPGSVVKWQKDGEAIANLPDLIRRSWTNEDGSLSIKPTSMADYGEYTCEVVNSTGFAQTAKAYLDVQYKAKVIYTPREVYLPYGRPAVLDCHFRSNPALKRLHWEKDGFLYDPYNVPGVFFRGNGSLFFNKVDESHAGLYSCTPENILGTEGPSPQINVIVQRPPVFTATPNSIYLRKLGDSITIPCDALDSDGQRRPTIIWSKRDGSALPEGRHRQEGGNITIDNLHEDDRGVYLCSATNEAATVTTETELMIENVPPRAPYNLVASSSANTVTLRWSPASSMQPFLYPTEWSSYTRPDIEYSVWYKAVEDEEWRKMPIMSSRITEATISNLYPGKEYEFMVLSQDIFSDGMFSKSIKYRTKNTDSGEDISNVAQETLLKTMTSEVGPPRDINIKLTPDGYEVSWLPPNHGVDALRVYVVRWFRGSEKFLMGAMETEETHYLLPDLEEDEVYHFEVESLSVNDFMAVSQRVSVFIPSYGNMRAAVIGIGLLIVIILIGAVVWYSHHKIQSRKDGRK